MSLALNIQPSPTLLISNLDTKIKKPELKSQLYALFTPYGRIIDLVAVKTPKQRGTAFIVFEKQSAATAALRGLSGEPFYLRELKITYAKTMSNATRALEDPTYDPLLERETLSHAQRQYEELEANKDMEETTGKRTLDMTEEGANKRVKRAGDEDDDVEMEMDDEDDAGANGSSGRTLILTNLPAEATEKVLQALLGTYPGFQKVSPSSAAAPSTLPAPNPGAKTFVAVYESTEQAEHVVKEVNGYLMKPEWVMGVAIA